MTKNNRHAARLPKGWKTYIRSAVLHSISLTKYSVTEAQGWAIRNVTGVHRWKVEIERLQQDLSQRREELQIKDARMAHLPPHRRPH